MAFQKILIAVDRTGQAEDVFDRGLDLAKAFHAELKLVHCMEHQTPMAATDPTGIGAGAGWPTSTWPALGTTGLTHDLQLGRQGMADWENTREAAEDWLKMFAERAQLSGVQALSTERVVGNVADSICDLAKTWRADLVVVGRKGRSGIEEALLGSVSNHIVHHAPCTVMVVQDATNH